MPDKSIAVLPFIDLSQKHDQEYFSDGLSEELLDQLAPIAELKVASRTSAFYFKGKTEEILDDRVPGTESGACARRAVFRKDGSRDPRDRTADPRRQRLSLVVEDLRPRQARMCSRSRTRSRQRSSRH